MSERSRTIILAVSLALNTFLIGAAVGGAYMWHTSGSLRTGTAMRGGLGLAAEALPTEKRKAFRQMLTQAREEAASDIAAARAGRLELAKLMMAEPLDRQAVDAQLSVIRQSDIALRARLEKAVIELAETLTPAERRNFVEGLRGHGAMLRGLNTGKN
jgi:uncharacterized membrane protein